MPNTHHSATTDPAPDRLLASVVVVAYHQEKALLGCLRSVVSQTIARDRYEIIVVDNGGNGDAKSTTAALWDQWLEPGENLGCSGGRNRGSVAASADVVFFIDDDGEICRNFLASGLATLETTPHAVAVRGRAVGKDHRLLTWILHDGADLGPDPVDNVSLELEGASCVRRDVFVSVGGFSEELAGGEGRDWLMRVKSTRPNATTIYEPSMILRHDYVQGVQHLLYKARRKHIGVANGKRGADLPHFNPPPGTFDFPTWRPPMLLRAVRRFIISPGLTWLGSLPLPARPPK